MAEAAYGAWRTDRDRGIDALLMTGTWADARALNQRAQADRLAAGEITSADEPAMLRAGQAAQVGDLILARQNDYQLLDDRGQPIRNGQRWTISNLDEHGAILTTGDRTVNVPRRYLAESATLGYAVSVDGSQGVTADTAHALAGSDQLVRERAYVALTRGKSANHAYLIDTDLPDLAGAPAVTHPTSRARDLFTAAASQDKRDRSAHDTLRDRVIAWEREPPDLATQPVGAVDDPAQIDADARESEEDRWRRKVHGAVERSRDNDRAREHDTPGRGV